MLMHSILIIGQSNMAGRGFVNEVEPIENDRIQVLRNGRWWPMYTPVNPDRVTAGVSLVESFADLSFPVLTAEQISTSGRWEVCFLTTRATWQNWQAVHLLLQQFCGIRGSPTAITKDTPYTKKKFQRC